MKKNYFVYTLLLIVMTTTVSLAQNSKSVKEYLSIPGPITFDGKAYNLSWSSHPSENFYKQEYIQKGDTADRYKTMIMLDVLTGQTEIKSIVQMKIAELKKMKETNPMVNYNAFDNPKTGESMIDFLVSANTPDGKQLSIVERNVYRYKTFTDKKGKKGIVLFAVSTRSYGNNIDKFLIALKAKKMELVNSVSQYKIPDITIKN